MGSRSSIEHSQRSASGLRLSVIIVMSVVGLALASASVRPGVRVAVGSSQGESAPAGASGEGSEPGVPVPSPSSGDSVQTGASSDVLAALGRTLPPGVVPLTEGSQEYQDAERAFPHDATDLIVSQSDGHYAFHLEVVDAAPDGHANAAAILDGEPGRTEIGDDIPAMINLAGLNSGQLLFYHAGYRVSVIVQPKVIIDNPASELPGKPTAAELRTWAQAIAAELDQLTSDGDEV